MSDKNIVINTQGGTVITGGTFSNVQFVAQQNVVYNTEQKCANGNGDMDEVAVVPDTKAMTDIEEITTQEGDNEVARHRRTKECSFRHIVVHADVETLMQRLHQLIDGRRGADVVCVLLKCMQDGYISRRPTQKEFVSEFELIGGWKAIHNYMDDNNINALDRANKIIIF